jgi:acyl-CoA thioesterase FadM
MTDQRAFQDGSVSAIGVSDEKKQVFKADELAFGSGASKTFEMEFDVFLKDSNAYGNVYFSRHFDWQGMVRESWFSKRIFKNMFELDGVFITKRANIEYLSEAYPFQTIKAQLNTQAIKKTSFDIVISFLNSETNTLISTGRQTIIFASKEKIIKKIPGDILAKIKLFEINVASI